MRSQDRLPTDTGARILALVERSRPNSVRPRLSDPELEARLVEAEAERAVDLAAREDVFDRLDRAKQMVDDSKDGTVFVELDDEDSVVHHVAALRKAEDPE